MLMALAARGWREGQVARTGLSRLQRTLMLSAWQDVKNPSIVPPCN
jgi:hypothetical protein